MNKLEQAAQQILEALEGIGFVSDYWNEKVTALRKALAEQAEQEPVADIVYDEFGPRIILRKSIKELPDGMQLFTAPVRTKDLTDDEIREIEMSVEPFAIDFARAVIAADREKNK